MLMTITSTAPQATDLGFLLHKHPERVQTFDLAFGKAHVFYPEAGPVRCTAALLLDIDPVGLVRRQRGGTAAGGPLDQYVNDRPYAASSFLSVAIAEVFGSALAGRCDARPELATTPLPLQACLTAVPCRGGEAFLRQLFEPLGYAVGVKGHALDARFPEWGASAYFTVVLEGNLRLRDLLAHLYVLIPVLDDDKHYWVGEEEVEKLLRHGTGWLERHPARDQIVRRYLRHRGRLTRMALARLSDGDLDPDEADQQLAQEEAQLEEPIRLGELRIGAVIAALKQANARRVLDLGCGEGRLLAALLKDPFFEQIVGLDVSYRSLETAKDRLQLDRLPQRQRDRLTLLHGSLVYRDARLGGYDAAAVVEVIEHLDLARLEAFARVLFEFARPRVVVMTTPNAEYNVRWERLAAGGFRHRDHRFEWTRRAFQAWAGRVAARFGYAARFLPVGPDDPEVGAPTQMGIFTMAEQAPPP